eukprot:TRINITY_DN7773_c0_g1_i4.p1 TRINITY_DN7773_c0_g1~~TRINITY_DN7773_c0_g1_i4.p1  ORF type:complete len:373 (-),score=48.66 TRINITY_DN7773_c0_g1_i4:384-1502(-)
MKQCSWIYSRADHKTQYCLSEGLFSIIQLFQVTYMIQWLQTKGQAFRVNPKIPAPRTLLGDGAPLSTQVPQKSRSINGPTLKSPPSLSANQYPPAPLGFGTPNNQPTTSGTSVGFLSSKNSEQKKAGAMPLPNQVGSEENSAEDDEEFLDDVWPSASNTGKKARASVSAEAYGLWNKKGAFVPKVVPKSEEQKARIRQRLNNAFMFSALDEQERDIVVNAMDEKKYRTGEVVIRQGENGDLLYVVDSGSLKCFKKFDGENQPRYLKTYVSGESFGELALLYNAPRAATIQADSDSVLFALDRETFNNIVKEATVKKRQRYEDFLKRVELLGLMDVYERNKIADGLKTAFYKKGDYIVRQVEIWHNFLQAVVG